MGSVLVVRQDRKPLLPLHVEAMSSYCRSEATTWFSHYDGELSKIVPLSKEAVLANIRRPAFLEFWEKFIAKKIEEGVAAVPNHVRCDQANHEALCWQPRFFQKGGVEVGSPAPLKEELHEELNTSLLYHNCINCDSQNISLWVLPTTFSPAPLQQSAIHPLLHTHPPLHLHLSPGFLST